MQARGGGTAGEGKTVPMGVWGEEVERKKRVGWGGGGNQVSEGGDKRLRISFIEQRKREREKSRTKFGNFTYRRNTRKVKQ